jgi:hypothetical protein
MLLMAASRGLKLDGVLTIDRRPLAIVADDKSKTYGEADPALTYGVGATAAGTGLVNGDTLNGNLARVAGEAVADGPYAIGQGTLSAGDNYTIDYTGANLVITSPAPPVTQLQDPQQQLVAAEVAATGQAAPDNAVVQPIAPATSNVGAMPTPTLVDGTIGGLAGEFGGDEPTTGSFLQHDAESVDGPPASDGSDDPPPAQSPSGQRRPGICT